MYTNECMCIQVLACFLTRWMRSISNFISVYFFFFICLINQANLFGCVALAI